MNLLKRYRLFAAVVAAGLVILLVADWLHLTRVNVRLQQLDATQEDEIVGPDVPAEPGMEA